MKASQESVLHSEAQAYPVSLRGVGGLGRPRGRTGAEQRGNDMATVRQGGRRLSGAGKRGGEAKNRPGCLHSERKHDLERGLT